MQFIPEVQETAHSVWKFSREGGRCIVTDGTLQFEANTIDALNREAMAKINVLNKLRDETSLNGHMRHIFVQDNPLSGPVVKYCVYHREDGPRPRDMMMGGYYEEATDMAASYLLAERKRWLDALTPSADTKGAYIGEFSFSEEIFDGETETYITVNRTVPWTTIKEIMAAIRVKAGEA
jgi:hypothetical protein